MVGVSRLALLLLVTQFALVFALKGAVGQLDAYRVPQGGFKNTLTAEQSLGATVDALLLHRLYGFNVSAEKDVEQFVKSLSNANGGFSEQVGFAANLGATRQALDVLQLLGKDLPAVGAFVLSLWDPNSKLFADRSGEKGDLKATADAVNSLAALGKLGEAKSQLEQIKQQLESRADTDHFKSGAHGAVADNFYGVSAATHAGFQFKDPKKWVKHVTEQQQKDGSWGSLEDTVLALKTLKALQTATKVDAFSGIDHAALRKFLGASVAPNSLRTTTLAHSALALSGLYDNGFEVLINFVTVDGAVIKGKKILQGVQLKPTVAVANIFNGESHSGLTVTLTGSQKEGAPETIPFSWDSAAEHYAADTSYSTQKRLGPVTFTLTFSNNVPTLGDVSFSITDERQVSYDIKIKSEAISAGKSIKPNENVALGTEFNFAVTIRNHTVSNILKGDFVVTFRVIDSSGVVVDEQSSDRTQSSDALKFSWALKSAGIPSGRLAFVFSVKQRGTTEAHSEETVAYHFAIQMVATNINFNSAKYKLGDKLELKADIASLADLRTAVAYDKKHLEAMKVFADFATAGGRVLESLKSVVKKDGVVFEFAIPNTFEWVGTHFVTFHYVSEQGTVELQNYDSKFQELYEEALNFTVKANLRLTQMSDKPKVADYHYGNTVTFKFQVKDQESGNFVWGGKNDVANVYLLLKQQQQRGVSSLYEPAVTVKDAKGTPQNLVIKWNINPNAASGNGQLSIVAQDADGNVVPITQDSDNKPFDFAVKISGDIKVSSKQYTEVTSVEASRSVFIVELDLTCQDKQLKDAQLGCLASYSSKAGVSTSIGEVAVVSGTNGGYQVSWTSAHKNAPSGNYHLEFFRAKDLSRTRKDNETSTEPVGKPLFEVSFYHEAAKGHTLPVKSEFLALFLLGAAFLAISNKKLSYSK